MAEVRSSSELRCSRCGKAVRHIETLMDSRTGKVVRIFRCGGCGNLEWDEEG